VLLPEVPKKKTNTVLLLFRIKNLRKSESPKSRVPRGPRGADAAKRSGGRRSGPAFLLLRVA
jgi:hypothetical protein